MSILKDVLGCLLIGMISFVIWVRGHEWISGYIAGFTTIYFVVIIVKAAEDLMYNMSDKKVNNQKILDMCSKHLKDKGNER